MYAKLIHKKEYGIGLIETLAAVALGVIVITSLVSLSIFSLRSSTLTKQNLVATKEANRQIELMRNYRDSNTWTNFISSVVSDCSSQCYVNDSTSTLSVNMGFTSGTDDGVSTYIKVTDTDGSPVKTSPPSTVVRINVTSTYLVGGVPKYVYLYTDLSSWRGL